jgi:hypothetical protein
LVSGIAGSNPARVIDVWLLGVYVLLSCVGRGLCDGLITHPEESYRVSNCVIKKRLSRRLRPDLGCRAIRWMGVREVGLEGVNWINLAQDRNHWWAVVNTVMNILDP